jgi:hypothetical protein
MKDKKLVREPLKFSFDFPFAEGPPAPMQSFALESSQSAVGIAAKPPQTNPNHQRQDRDSANSSAGRGQSGQYDALGKCDGCSGENHRPAHSLKCFH